MMPQKETLMTVNGTSADAGRITAPPILSVSRRLDWVDYAKGICIVMVVMMHSVLGVEAAVGETGFMHYVVVFAKPFRMPDFFLISGLFLPVVIDREWRTYLDRKVVHFAYFYFLWVTIQFGFKAPAFAAATSWREVGLLYLESFIEPFGTLWFIYLLPVFFVVAKASRKMPPPLIWGVAALLEMAHVGTGWTAIDEFCARFVYFYSGYCFAAYVFALSNRARKRPELALAGLALWALVNGSVVASGASEWPLVSLGLGLSGACAIVTIGTLLAQMHWLNFLRYFGEHSIVIYLAFFLPMATTRTFLLKTGWIDDIGVMSLTVTLAGIVGSLGAMARCFDIRRQFPVRTPRRILDRTETAAHDAASRGVASHNPVVIARLDGDPHSTASNVRRHGRGVLGARFREQDDGLWLPVYFHPLLYLRQFLAITFGVAEVGKTLVVRVRAEHTAGMLDRTPIDLRARGHLAGERNGAVGVGAIGAVDLLDGVEIGQMVAVEDQVVAPTDSRDLVDRKTDRLKGHDPYVHQNHRDQQRINQWRAEYDKRICVCQITRRSCPDRAMDALDVLIENDLSSLEAEAQLFPPFRQFGLDFGFHRPQLRHQSIELRGHGGPSDFIKCAGAHGTAAGATDSRTP